MSEAKVLLRSKPVDYFFGDHAALTVAAAPYSRLAHACNLDIDQVAETARKTNIICTFGQPWESEEDIAKMIRGGMNILRFNLSMVSPDTCRSVVKYVRALDELSGFSSPVGIAMDMTAAPIRTGYFEGGRDAQVSLEEGSIIELTTNESFRNMGTSKIMFIDTRYFPQLILSVHKGDRIHIGDGMATLIVKNIGMDSVTCMVEEGGIIEGYKRVCLPRERLYHISVTANYLNDLKLAAECEVDYVFTSLVDNAEVLALAREYLPEHTKLFVKIETRESLKNLSELLKYADGIIISRADLGLSFSSEKIFKIQKYIMGHCNVAHKPVFVIGQLLESMVSKPRPTRAESSDVANAVLDGADGIVLTVETSRGIYPLLTLETVDRICREAERAICHDTLRTELHFSRQLRGIAKTDISHVTAISAVEAAVSCAATAIFVITTTGNSAFSIASSKPNCPVIAITRHPTVARHSHAFRGLYPFVYTGPRLEDWSEDMDVRINAAVEMAKARKLVKPKDTVIIVTGSLAGTGKTNTLQVFQIPEVKGLLKVVSSSQHLTYPDRENLKLTNRRLSGVDELTAPL